MQKITREITKEQYHQLEQMEPKQAYNFIEGIAWHSGYHPAGYGFYSPQFYIQGVKHIVSWLCGNSCD